MIFSTKNQNTMVFNSKRFHSFSLILVTENSTAELGRGGGQIGQIEVVVPQGLCLGPLLFLIYNNYLPKTVQHSTVSMHAGDTSRCLKSKDIFQLNRAMSRDLEDLDFCLEGNRLSLNIVKTQSV